MDSSRELVVEGRGVGSRGSMMSDLVDWLVNVDSKRIVEAELSRAGMLEDGHKSIDVVGGTTTLGSRGLLVVPGTEAVEVCGRVVEMVVGSTMIASELPLELDGATVAVGFDGSLVVGSGSLWEVRVLLVVGSGNSLVATASLVVVLGSLLEAKGLLEVNAVVVVGSGITVTVWAGSPSSTSMTDIVVGTSLVMVWGKGVMVRV